MVNYSNLFSRRKIWPTLILACALWQLKINYQQGSTVKVREIVGTVTFKTNSTHTTTPEGRKIIYFLHIHKSGGSTMCKQAFLQGLNVNRKENCNVQKDQHCCGGKDSIEAQLHYASHTLYSFVACEREMYDAMAPSHYDYVVTLRDSATRYMSHWNHIRSEAKLTPKYSNRDRKKTNRTATKTKAKAIKGNQRRVLRSPSKETQGMRKVPPKVSTQKLPQAKEAIKINEPNEKYFIRTKKENFFVGNFTAWWESQPDNYSTRMICGSQCLEIPKYKLTPDLFRTTLKRLSLFSHILFVEDMDASYTKFSKAVGWKVGKKVTHENQRIDSSHSKKTVAELMEENNLKYDPLVTTLDDALYDFAKQRYESNYPNDAEERIEAVLGSQAVQDYFREGGKKHCENPCCGPCSMWR